MKTFLLTFDGKSAERIQAVDRDEAEMLAEAIAFDAGENVFVKNVIPVSSFRHREKPVSRQIAR